jgi:hypothetical protein
MSLSFLAVLYEGAFLLLITGRIGIPGLCNFSSVEPFALTCGPDWGCISVSSFPFTSCHAGLSWLDPIEESLGGGVVQLSFLMWFCLGDERILLVTSTIFGSNPLLGRRPAPRTSWRLGKRRKCEWGKMLRFELWCILNSFWRDSTCRRLPAIICKEHLCGTTFP